MAFGGSLEKSEQKIDNNGTGSEKRVQYVLYHLDFSDITMASDTNTDDKTDNDEGANSDNNTDEEKEDEGDWGRCS